MIAKILSEQALERILAVSWEPDETRINSQIALFKEYLRRAALWVKALDCQDEWPFFDIPAQVYPSERADQTVIERLRSHFTQTPFYVVGIIEKTCEWFIHWENIKDLPEVTQYSLPDPYAPLILMYERGGIFSTEHGFFNFSVGGLPQGQWHQYNKPLPLLQLDDKTLEKLDLYSEDLEKIEQLIAINNLQQGIDHWNRWRECYYITTPNFRSQDFRGQNFRGADLNGAIFDNANLAHANFENTVLIDSTFNNANLEGADFTSADLTGSVLSGAINRHQANFTNSIDDKKAEVLTQVSTSTSNSSKFKV